MDRKFRSLAVLGALIVLAVAFVPQVTALSADKSGYSRAAPLAAKDLLLHVTHAGKRLVAVGDHGHVMISDDSGKSWHQARSVPTTTTLTSVFFLDEQQGWAVGHGGIVIGSKDGGETWTLLAGKLDAPDSLFSVWFGDVRHGIAVGPFGYVIETGDGGQTWSKREIAHGDDGERHLNQIVAGRDGTLLIAAEGGTIFRSEDAGHSWSTIRAPYKGSLWGGLALTDGTLLLYGMRGHVLRSFDKGLTWTDAVAATDQALTGAAQFSNGSLVLVGLGGAIVNSRNGGQTFEATIAPERTSFTAVAEGGGGVPILFGVAGVQGLPDAK